MIALVAVTVVLATPAARLDGVEITVEAVDARTDGRAESLRTALTRVARDAAWSLVDERLDPNERPRAQAREQTSVRVDLPPARALERALPADRPIAWVGGEVIDGAALETRAALAFYRLRGELYRDRHRRLRSMIDETLLAAEARRRSVSLEALIDAHAADSATIIALSARAPRSGDVREDPSTPTGEARRRPLVEFRARYAAREALLEKLRAAAEIEILLEAPPRPRVEAAEGEGLVLGPSTSADRTVIVFADYRSRSSRRLHAELDRLREQAPGVRIVLRDFLPTWDGVAAEAARLARCADRFGHLSAMREALLSRPPPGSGESWFSAAERARLARSWGVEDLEFRRCLDDPAVVEAVGEGAREARRLGFPTAPGLVVAGIALGGVQSAETLARALQPVAN